ncbi:MAG: adenylate/guanylate cyclase domain-containing protein [Candidatus Riflebacteria bacterium]|nr:adenylate/guanylate cyclase domain-containing protein [Candidatus Riflebacteria bacterium]
MQSVLAGVAAGNLETELRSARADELGELAGQLDEMIRGLRRRRDLARFVSGTLDARVRQEAAGDGLGPRVDAGVVLVSDLRGFTSMSETHPPEEIVALLNSHIEAMTGPIHAEGGRIEQFIGDAIVALFTGPGPREGRPGGDGSGRMTGGEAAGASARAAVRAACAMRRAHLALQETRRGQGRFPYEMGVGIDGGPLLMGVIAGEGRAEFSVIGPARDGAEELETRSREGRHSRILVADALWPSLAVAFTATPGPGGGCREILLDTPTPAADRGRPAGDLPRPGGGRAGSPGAPDGVVNRGADALPGGRPPGSGLPEGGRA